MDPRDIDLVIVPDGHTPHELEDFTKSGGSVLIAGTIHPGLGLPPAVRLWQDAKSTYMRIENHTMFPSLEDTWVLFWEGDYLELEASSTPVTLIPPGQFGPPDKVASLETRTDKPGLILSKLKRGTIGYVPWNIGDLYYRYSNDKHRMFISDLVDYLLEGTGRQLITSAHPSVEITVMHQPDGDGLLLHLINLSGHSGTAFFDAVEMQNIPLKVKGEFSSATMLERREALSLEKSEGYASFQLPRLLEYNVVLLEN